MILRLAPVAPDDLASVAHITVAPEQVMFSGTVAEAFETAEQGVDFHAIVESGHAVGFFKIDTTYSQSYPFASDGSLGLRGFMIDLDQQGRGIATRAVALLPEYLAGHYDAPALYLTINMSNPAAIRCYRAGGFSDTGEVWERGIAGPQHVMRMALMSVTELIPSDTGLA
ncbi:GNAT family protein [uncultured Sulfitobacter sp.]|uniref:GNAT family N-acetyltransferase n=1 Tax=uncultured Sulfitobacter sp. TaxID=191468 RepID=UPI002624EE01|nr:GNAT family protein [uncultured Sulfitobacter sp.]